jgi:hypothetical protein
MRFSRAAVWALAVSTLVPACAPRSTTEIEASSDKQHALDAIPPSTLGINIDPTNDHANPLSDDIGALGATRVRIELKVDYHDGQSDDDELNAAFDAYDAALSRLGGASVLFIVDYATLDERRAGPKDSDAYRDAFSARAAAVASHYASLGVDHFEIWNEEDLCAGDYCPRIEPEPYAALLGDAADAIHSANPAARVALGGLGSGDWESYLNDVKNALGDRWASVDVVGVHPYTHWPKATGRGPNELEYMLSRAHDIGGKPLWLTEWGDGGDALAAVQTYFEFFASGSDEAGYVDEAYFFAWSDGQHDAPDAFGLFDRDGNQKDAEWNAFHDAASAASQ